MNDVKKYLEEYKIFKDDLDFINHKMLGLKSPIISSEAHSTVKVSKYTKAIEKKKEIIDKMNEREEFIESHFYGKERLAIWYRYIDLMSIDEVAHELDISRKKTCELIYKPIKLLNLYNGHSLI